MQTISMAFIQSLYSRNHRNHHMNAIYIFFVCAVCVIHGEKHCCQSHHHGLNSCTHYKHLSFMNADIYINEMFLNTHLIAIEYCNIVLNFDGGLTKNHNVYYNKYSKTRSVHYRITIHSILMLHVC